VPATPRMPVRPGNRKPCSCRKPSACRSVRTWLLSIAAHHCIDLGRRRSLVEFLPSGAREFAHAGPGPEAALIHKESADEVGRMLQGLNADERAAVILTYWYELSQAEIAATTGSTGRSRRARRRSTSSSRRSRIRAQPIRPPNPPRSRARRPSRVRPSGPSARRAAVRRTLRRDPARPEDLPGSPVAPLHRHSIDRRRLRFRRGDPRAQTLP